MTLIQREDVTLSPGQAHFGSFTLAPSEVLFIARSGVDRVPGRIVAYVDSFVGRQFVPSGAAIFARAQSLPLTDVNVFLQAPTVASRYGGWFYRIYAINGSNYSPFRFLALTETL